MSFALETQEAETGRWFPIIRYSPGNADQRERAERTAQVLRDIAGLYVRIHEGVSADV